MGLPKVLWGLLIMKNYSLAYAVTGAFIYVQFGLTALLATIGIVFGVLAMAVLATLWWEWVTY